MTCVSPLHRKRATSLEKVGNFTGKRYFYSLEMAFKLTIHFLIN